MREETREQAGRGAAAAMMLSLALAPCVATAQPRWAPGKPVEIVVPTAAGGINDQLSRLLQKVLQERKLAPTPVVVLNKPGGNQTLAAVYLAQHARDPHCLMYATPTLFTNQIAGLTDVRYDAYTPLALLFVEHTVISVRADSPIRTMRDLLARLKADPASVAFGMVSRGGPNHLALAQAVREGGIDPRALKVAIFKTNAESMTGLAGGHLDAVGSSVSAALPFVQAGKVRMIAVTAPQRMGGALANVPTLAEEGLKVNVASNWRAVFGAPQLTPIQIGYWSDVLELAVAEEAWAAQLDANQLSPRFMGSRDFARYLRAEYDATRGVMSELGLAKGSQL